MKTSPLKGRRQAFKIEKCRDDGHGNREHILRTSEFLPQFKNTLAFLVFFFSLKADNYS